MELIGVPFDLGGKKVGSRLGPAAVRLAGLGDALGALGCVVKDGGDINVSVQPERLPGGLRGFAPALACIGSLKSRVAKSVAAKDIPLVIGGDHFIAVGAIAGALEACQSDLALLWIDAHADLNTPASSPSGNLHGMPVSSLLGLSSGVDGLADRQWQEITKGLVGPARLTSENCAWFGLRDVDSGERAILSGLPGRLVVTMHDVDRYGVVECLARFDSWMKKSGVKNLWVSFDVDVLDPVLAPGTGTAVRGGLSYREMHLFAEVLYELMAEPNCSYSLVGLDVVEINPLSDTNNITAITAVEWIASLFGKRILGPRK